MDLRRIARLALVVLGIFVVAKFLPDLRVGPVSTGVDAVTAATKKGSKSSGKYTSSKSGSSKTVLETDDGQAMFIEWRQGRELGKPVLLVEMAPVVGQGTAVLVVPNKNEKDPAMSPAKEIVDLAPKVKIGDILNVTYAQTATGYIAVKMSVAKASDDNKFTFDATRTVQVGGKPYQTVVLRRKQLSWTMLIPNAGTPQGSKPAPDESLAKAVAKFKMGDPVNVEYDVSDYLFMLKKITAAPLSGRGTFARTGKIDQKDKSIPTVVFKSGASEMTLLLASGSDAAVKDLKPSQQVEFKYHREGGLMWLDEIVAK